MNFQKIKDLWIWWVGLFLFFGFVHIITGSAVSIPRITLKESFGFSETFINTDQIIDLPYIIALAQHPIGVRILQREGYAESDFKRDQRIKEENREFDAEMEKAIKDAERMKQEGEKIIRNSQKYR